MDCKASTGDISGLRQQIVSNAIYAYPKDVERYCKSKETKNAKASDSFDVVVIIHPGSKKEHSYRACLMDGELPFLKESCVPIMSGDAHISVEEALRSLLKVTSNALLQRFEKQTL